MAYRDLQVACKEAGLKANGGTDVLIDRLVNHQLGHNAPEQVEPPVNPTRFAGLKASDPNPDSPNWDMAGRWIRT